MTSLSRPDPGSRTTDPGGEGHLTTDPDGEGHLNCSGHVVCSPHSHDLFRASKGRLSPYIGPPTDIHRRRRACLEKCAAVWQLSPPWLVQKFGYWSFPSRLDRFGGRGALAPRPRRRSTKTKL